jgi:transcriptional regulator with XRE-family HTH domain
MRKSVYSPESALLARAVSEARKLAGIHQADLADRLGMDQTTISNIERGQRRLDVFEFYLIMREIQGDPIAVFADLVRKWDQMRGV